MSAKRLLFVFSNSPFGNALGAEGLDAVLAASVFDQDVTLIFQLDGIYQLMKDGDTADIGIKDHRKGFKALEMYGVDTILVDAMDMEARGITESQLAIPAQPVDRTKITETIHQADAIFTF
ncbi:sulfurtransferase TusC [Hahella sp. CCB-MM4]|uniref:sulfurtransferase complex subunit TusC n=1 Tax=Hahella sp. (strain CCB-MM4) TaxID=1926491 RepID=UPI000B9C0EE2|nr:sulfurtransferase complex subunit TusC [Hahella sp. CCB-MM4]OZG73621.1 sulfurtransferase TusC [Hahella sp. CCB-MM4]